MFDILTVIPGIKKATGSGWYSFNAVCCQHRGHKTDKRKRGGIKFTSATNWVYNCFNCDYKCAFVLGKRINSKTQQLLKWCGIDDDDINRWSFESFQQRDFVDSLTLVGSNKPRIKFTTSDLPKDAVLIDKINSKHKIYLDYLHKRGLTTDDYPFMITPNEKGRNRERIIVPYFYEEKLVGYTSRFLDNKIPKYINVQQPGYVFNYDRQLKNHQFCLVVEGVFDAISLNGCAVLHNTINDEQAQFLQALRKRIIIVPDQDTSGSSICERALDLGFAVSIPEWQYGIKDVNDAIIKYGRLPTLLSILENATTSRIKVEIARKKLDKRIRN
jgi:hypothetical protein